MAQLKNIQMNYKIQRKNVSLYINYCKKRAKNFKEGKIFALERRKASTASPDVDRKFKVDTRRRLSWTVDVIVLDRVEFAYFIKSLQTKAGEQFMKHIMHKTQSVEREGAHIYIDGMMGLVRWLVCVRASASRSACRRV
jgi:hypothetical protein